MRKASRDFPDVRDLDPWKPSTPFSISLSLPGLDSRTSKLEPRSSPYPSSLPPSHPWVQNSKIGPGPKFQGGPSRGDDELPGSPRRAKDVEKPFVAWAPPWPSAEGAMGEWRKAAPPPHPLPPPHPTPTPTPPGSSSTSSSPPRPLHPRARERAPGGGASRGAADGDAPHRTWRPRASVGRPPRP